MVREGGGLQPCPALRTDGAGCTPRTSFHATTRPLRSVGGTLRLSSGGSMTDSPAAAPLGAPRLGAQGRFLPGWSQPTTAADGLFLRGLGLPSRSCPWPGGNFLRSLPSRTPPPARFFPPRRPACVRSESRPCSSPTSPPTRRHPQYHPCPSHASFTFASWTVQTNLLVITRDLTCVRYCFMCWGSSSGHDTVPSVMRLLQTTEHK